MTSPEQERTYWDELAADPVNMGGGPTMPDLDHYVDVLEKWYPERAGTVLELGCGIGRLLVPMADRHPDDLFHGVDISAHMAAQVPSRPNVVVHVGDGRTIPDGIDGVRFVWSVLVFQHVTPATQSNYLHEVARVIASGGRFVLQWIDQAERHDYSHPVGFGAMLRWADTAGLRFVEGWRDRRVEAWLWAVWEKP